MKKKNKKNKKKKMVIICSIIFLIIIVITAIIVVINNSKVKVELKKNNKININRKIYNTELIKEVKNGKIISKREKINTQKTGKKTIKLKIKNKFNKIIEYKYQIEIIDKEKPEIIAAEKIEVEQGNEADLLKNVVVKDNSKEEIKAKVEGEYDFNKPGTYELKYIAEDSNKNKIEKAFTLEVKEKVIEKEKKVVQNTNKSTKTSKGYTVQVIDGISYINGIMIVNKTYSIPSSYNPGGLTSEFNNAFGEMQKAASNEGLGIHVISGFRSFNTQKNLYNNYANRDGYAAADTYSARAGHSEHQTGLAADLNAIDDNFGNTPEGMWLHNNAWKYGFILRYPKGKTAETGYMYESWHFRYVGRELAAKLYNGGNWISLESYFGITSQYE